MYEIVKHAVKLYCSQVIFSEVEQLCDRVGIIRKGKMVEVGTLEEMRHLTRMRFTVETAQPLQDVEQQTGIHDLSKQENVYRFQVDSDQVGEVIQYLSRFHVKN